MLLATLAGVVAQPVAAQDLQTLVETRRVNADRPMTVDVTFAAGRLAVQPSEHARTYRVSMSYLAEVFEPTVAFDPQGNDLTITLDDGDIRLKDLDGVDQTLALELPADVPLDLSLGFGALEADIELGGLTLRSAEIKTGASETLLSFASPTHGTCERLEVSVGAAEFEARGIGHSGCRSVVLEGAIGEMTLDFSGDRWDGEHRLSVKVGLGDVRIRVPEAVGIRLDADRFFASVTRAGLVRQGSAFVTPGFASASSTLIIDVDAALGNVEIERIR